MTGSGCGPVIFRLLRLSSPGCHSQAALECSKTQLQIQQPAACWVPLINPGLSTPKNWEESKWGRGKGSVCFDLFIFSFSFYQAQFFGKKKRISLWAGALLGVLPSLASPSTPPSVQTAKQQFLETHWKVWASPEAGDSWYLHGKVLGSLLFTLILFKNRQLFEAHLLPTASVCKMRLKISSLEKFPKLLCSSVLPLTVWLTEYNGGKY